VKHWYQAAALLVVLAGLAFAGALAVNLFAGTDSSSGLPDIRGNIPRGDYRTDFRWVMPLLDAGYCVSFRYDAQGGPIDLGDGKYEGIADSYYIFDENLDSAQNRPTVTVTVSGTPLGGPTVDWNTMPKICPDLSGGA
jgi:hypothetical protein